MGATEDVFAGGVPWCETLMTTPQFLASHLPLAAPIVLSFMALPLLVTAFLCVPYRACPLSKAQFKLDFVKVALNLFIQKWILIFSRSVKFCIIRIVCVYESSFSITY